MSDSRLPPRGVYSQHPAQPPPVLVRPLPTPHSGSAPPTSASSSSASMFSSNTRGTYATTPSDEGGHRRTSGPHDPTRGRREASSSSAYMSPTHHQPPPRAPSPLPPLPTSHPSYSTSSAQPRSPSSPITHQHPPRSPSFSSLPPGTYCTATKDHETYSYVDLSACTSPGALRETVLTKLQIQDDEFWACQFFQTRMGGKGGSGARLNDDDLWDACSKAGDAGYTVFVKMTHQTGEDVLPAGASAAGRVHSSGGPSPTSHSMLRGKSASVSSRSDVSSPFSPLLGGPSGGEQAGGTSPLVNQLGGDPSAAGGTRGNAGERPSIWDWPQAQGGHRATASHASSGNGAGGLSPPVERGRAGSVTPTAPQQQDEYARGGERERDDSRRDVAMARQLSSSQGASMQGGQSQGSHDVVMLPGGPIRRLPIAGPPPAQHSHPYAQTEYEPDSRRMRVQTAPIAPTSAPGWPPSRAPQYYQPQPPQPIRPLPSTTPTQYHNLPLHNHPPYTQEFQQSASLLLPNRQVVPAKSADNLREHYRGAFDNNPRPTPPVPPIVPFAYGNLPPQGQYYPTPPKPPQYPQPPPQPPRPPQVHPYSNPPPQSRPPPPHPPQSQGSYSSSFPYPSPNRQSPFSFDPRVMMPPPPPSSLPPSNARPPPTVPSYTSPTMRQQSYQGWHPDSSAQRRPTNESAAWSPAPQDRPYTQQPRFPPPPPPSLPDISGSIQLQPGGILQHPPSRPDLRHRSQDSEDSRSPTSPSHNRSPAAPAVAFMRANDPSYNWASSSENQNRPRAHSSAYGPEAVPAPRRESGGKREASEGSGDVHRPSRGDIPPSLQPGRERDSGSSFDSSTSSSGHKVAGGRAQPASAPSPDDGAYDGLQEESNVYTSPPSSNSARSSTSASGPITPNSALGPKGDSFADAASNEWRKKLPVESPSPVSRTRRDDWGESVLSVDSGESTLTAASQGTLRQQLSNPTSPEASAPPGGRVWSTELDDEEDSTYLPGFAPPTRIEPVIPKSDRPSLRITTPATPPAKNNPRRTPGGPTSGESERFSSTGPRRSGGGGGGGRVGALSQPSGGIVRSGSFADREKASKDWAFRPKVEDVLENLEVFFPKHDLEKPVFDAPTPTAATPSPSASPATETPNAPVPAALKRVGATGLGYKKSIRVVAGDRKRNMLKASARAEKHSTLGTGLPPPASVMRRKSTKLFGSRLEEVTPAQIKQMDETIPESQAEDPDNFSFKWIKGELIGRGSYGKVYIAFNVTAGEAIAVKQVELPHTASDKEDKRLQIMVSSLKSEIELLKDLSHDNIVEYLGMEETPEHLSIFLEYVPGGSVGRMIRTHGKFPEDVIKDFTFQILNGLKYLHGLGILHRDLKGDNILCDHEGNCKISDFGTSKKSQDIYNNDANMSMQGSIFWMAPEVLQNNQMGYSAKADIWSLGCLCLEMFAGRRPWDQSEMFQTMIKLASERLAPPVPDDVILTPEAKSFFGACFQGEPDLRPRADQLMRHLFLKLDEDYAFNKTSLYRAIASTRDDAPVPSP